MSPKRMCRYFYYFMGENENNFVLPIHLVSQAIKHTEIVRSDSCAVLAFS